MNSLKRPWINLILAPLWFLLFIIIFSVYFSVNGVSEIEIPNKITENTPTLILIIQLCLLFTLLITSKKDGFNIFKNGWFADKNELIKDIFGGIGTGIVLAVAYIFLFSPMQKYLQINIGDYVPAGETMTALGKQTIIFFIANVIFAPFVEESLYRNYALSSFLGKYSKTKSVVFSIIMFGLLHWLGGFWYMLMTGIIVGLPFALITINRKNIIWVFVAHFTLNLIEYFYIVNLH